VTDSCFAHKGELLGVRQEKKYWGSEEAVRDGDLLSTRLQRASFVTRMVGKGQERHGGGNERMLQYSCAETTTTLCSTTTLWSRSLKFIFFL